MVRSLSFYIPKGRHVIIIQADHDHVRPINSKVQSAQSVWEVSSVEIYIYGIYTEEVEGNANGYIPLCTIRLARLACLGWVRRSAHRRPVRTCPNLSSVHRRPHPLITVPLYRAIVWCVDMWSGASFLLISCCARGRVRPCGCVCALPRAPIHPCHRYIYTRICVGWRA